MTLGDVREIFLGILNRSDCTTAVADRMLSLGTTLAQRDLRLPSMERVLSYTATPAAITTMALPSDCLDVIDVIPQGDNYLPLEKVSYRALLRRSNEVGVVHSYARHGSTLYLRGSVPVGGVVDLLYYGEFGSLAVDGDENELTTAAPDIMVYAGLMYAGDHFRHDERNAWVAKYAALLDNLNEMAQRDARTGGPMAVEPVYYDPGT